MDFKEACAILEVSQDASWDDIQAAYRLLVQVWHPDRFGHNPKLQDQAAARLKRINLAYETIRNGLGQRSTRTEPGDRDPAYADLSCWYLEGDIRVQRSGFRREQKAAVTVTNDGIALLLPNIEDPRQVCIYPAATIGAVQRGSGWWNKTGKFYRDCGFEPNDVVKFQADDPEGVLDSGFPVRLRFRDDYHAAVFAKRVISLAGLVRARRQVRKSQAGSSDTGMVSVGKFFLALLIIIIACISTMTPDSPAPPERRVANYSPRQSPPTEVTAREVPDVPDVPDADSGETQETSGTPDVGGSQAERDSAKVAPSAPDLSANVSSDESLVPSQPEVLPDGSLEPEGPNELTGYDDLHTSWWPVPSTAQTKGIFSVWLEAPTKGFFNGDILIVIHVRLPPGWGRYPRSNLFGSLGGGWLRKQRRLRELSDGYYGALPVKDNEAQMVLRVARADITRPDERWNGRTCGFQLQSSQPRSIQSFDLDLPSRKRE